VIKSSYINNALSYQKLLLLSIAFLVGMVDHRSERSKKQEQERQEIPNSFLGSPLLLISIALSGFLT
jgi:hypothetical protein